MEIVHLVFDKSDLINRKVAVAVDQLAAEQVKLGHNVILWEIGEAHNTNYQHRSYKTILFKVKNFIWSLNSEITNAITKLNTNTVIHFHGGFVPIYFPLALQLRKNNIPYIYTTHGTNYKINGEGAGFIKKMYSHLFQNILMKWSSALHLEGIDEKNQLDDASIANDKKVVFIPNGISYVKAGSPQKGKKNGAPVFCYSGKIDIHLGGLDILLFAFAEYKYKYFEKGELWILGDGVDMQEAIELTKTLKIQNHVFFKGNVFGKEKFDTLNKIDVFIRPCRFECNPNSILEAASCSVPAIVSKETNMGEYIRAYEAGYELNENTPNCLAKSMIQCLRDMNNYLWDAKRRNAFRMLNEKFQWNTIAKEHINVYQKVLVQQVA